jgi:hypothetical protein
VKFLTLLVLVPFTLLIGITLWLRIAAREAFRRAVHSLGHPDYSYDGPDGGFVDSGSSIAVHTDHRLVHLRRGRKWRSYPLDAVRGWDASRRPPPAASDGVLVVRVDDPATPEWRIDMPSLEQQTWCELLELVVPPDATGDSQPRGPDSL